MAGNKNRKDKEKQSVGRLRFPKRDEGEIFGVVTQLMGANQLKVLCEDGKERQCRIPGKMRKRVWVRENDVVVVKVWDFQPSKGDITWRYIGNQVGWLKRKGMLEKLPV